MKKMAQASAKADLISRLDIMPRTLYLVARRHSNPCVGEEAIEPKRESCALPQKLARQSSAFLAFCLFLFAPLIESVGKPSVLGPKGHEGSRDGLHAWPLAIVSRVRSVGYAGSLQT